MQDARSAARHTTGTDVMHPGTMLLDAVRGWATPVASERANRTHKETSAVIERGHGAHLSFQAQADFPTPSATSYGTSQNGINGKGGVAERPSAGTAGLEHSARHGLLPGTETIEGRKVLNPLFVEALMGWEMNWTLPEVREGRALAPFPPGPSDREGWNWYLTYWPYTRPAVAPDAVPHRIDRLRACGNGVVPAQAAAAFAELFEVLNVVSDDEVLRRRFRERAEQVGEPPVGFLAGGSVVPVEEDEVRDAEGMEGDRADVRDGGHVVSAREGDARDGLDLSRSDACAVRQETTGEVRRARHAGGDDVARCVEGAEGSARSGGLRDGHAAEGRLMGRGERGGVSESGDKDETRTPPSILEPLVKVLGPIGLDPCAHPAGVVKADLYVLLPKYREAEGSAYVPGGDVRRIIWGDGLQLDWSGRGLVFVNMPYSDIGPWGEKRHEADEVVFFSPVRTANRWWKQTFDDADAVCFLYDRVKHVGMKTHADFHQCLVFYSPERERVRAFFDGFHEQLGRVYVHERHWGWR